MTGDAREVLDLPHAPIPQSDGDYCERSWWECRECGETFDIEDEARAWLHAFTQAGFTLPRTVSTMEEWDGLPNNSVAVLATGRAVIKRPNGYAKDIASGQYPFVDVDALPATVLHAPKEKS